MHLLTCLFYLLIAEVKSQTRDLSADRILVPLNTVREDSGLFVICSTFGWKIQTEVYMYLCKNGTGIERKLKKKEENKSIFIINKVTQEHRGQFSCVSSPHEYEPATVHGIGHNVINISVIANVVAADLSLSGPSLISQGAQVTFVCSLPHVLQTMGDCDSVQSYLMKDGVILQVQGFELSISSATFVIQDIVQRDAGGYSCVVRPSQCFKQDEDQVTGNNVIKLQVKGFPVVITVSLTALVMLALVGICAFAFGKKAKLKKSNVDEKRQSATGIDVQPSDAQGLTTEDNASVLSLDDSWDIEDRPGSQNVADPYSYPAEDAPEYNEVFAEE